MHEKNIKAWSAFYCLRDAECLDVPERTAEALAEAHAAICDAVTAARRELHAIEQIAQREEWSNGGVSHTTLERLDDAARAFSDAHRLDRRVRTWEAGGGWGT